MELGSCTPKRKAKLVHTLGQHWVAALKLKWRGHRKMIHVWTHLYLSWSLLLITQSNHPLSVGSLSVGCVELIVNK